MQTYYRTRSIIVHNKTYIYIYKYNIVILFYSRDLSSYNNKIYRVTRARYRKRNRRGGKTNTAGRRV